ncbi:glycosyltransferase family protein [Bryocella elongata]|nr:hypothetical protein [Bryocella elongata]
MIERAMGADPKGVAAEPLFGGDPEVVRPVGRGETFPLFALGVIFAFASLAVCYHRGFVLLYGDAVAHLAIARRIFDARYPGLAQLGGVWLPLPHLLMVPFVRDMTMWQTGLAGAPMSMLSYAASVAGIWRLARRLMRQRWALVATAFYALNPNLLYLATTAMTEAVFLALFVWTIVATMEGIAAMRANVPVVARARMMLAGFLIMGQVFTRYDGWIFGAAVWCCFAYAWWNSVPEMKARLRTWFVVFTIIVAAGPLLWFWYNHHFAGDWLDFMRGPYSAKQIERRTAPPGQHYRGWHNPAWALLFYTRTAQIDAAAWEMGFVAMYASLWAMWVSLKAKGSGSRGQGSGLRVQNAESMQPLRSDVKLGLLLWVPLPFYVYSVAYGSVPIFIPQLWPHAYYNARYGMEMLPVLAIYTALAAEMLEQWLRGRSDAWAVTSAKLWPKVALALCALNCVGMMVRTPLVLKEAMVNARTRMALEKALAFEMETLPYDEPVMMSTTDHVGAVQVAGRDLKSMISEGDEQSWEWGLADPAKYAAFVIAIGNDRVAQAVKEHPQGLTEISVVCTSGQPCAKVYQSTTWKPAGH